MDELKTPDDVRERLRRMHWVDVQKVAERVGLKVKFASKRGYGEQYYKRATLCSRIVARSRVRMDKVTAAITSVEGGTPMPEVLKRKRQQKVGYSGWVEDYVLDNPSATHVEILRATREHFPDVEITVSQVRFRAGVIKKVLAKLDPDATKAAKQTFDPLIRERVKEAIEEATESLAEEVGDQFGETIMDAAVEAANEVAAATLSEYRKVEIIHRTAKGRITKRRKMNEIFHEQFQTILDLAECRVNVYLVGPTGCGKTHAAEQVARALDLPFGSISCSPGMSESQLAGWLLPRDGGSWGYVGAPFVDCYTKGGVFLFDELDNADPSTIVFLNSALSNDRMFVPQKFAGETKGDGVLKRHENFVAVGGANTFGTGPDAEYVRNQLDLATLDRFTAGTVYMDYSRIVEEHLTARAPQVLAWGMGIRESIREHGLRRVMSTRTMMSFAVLADEKDWRVDEWERAYFAGWAKDEVDRVKDDGRSALKQYEVGAAVAS